MLANYRHRHFRTMIGSNKISNKKFIQNKTAKKITFWQRF